MATTRKIHDPEGRLLLLGSVASRIHIRPDIHSDHTLLTVYDEARHQELRYVPDHPTIEWLLSPELVKELKNCLDEIVEKHL